MATNTVPAAAPGPPDPPTGPQSPVATVQSAAKGFLASMVAPVEPARPTFDIVPTTGNPTAGGPGDPADGVLDRTAPGISSASFRDADEAAGKDSAGEKRKAQGSIWKAWWLAGAQRWAKGGGAVNKRLDMKKAKAQAHQVKENRTTTVTKSAGLPVRNSMGAGGGSKGNHTKSGPDSSRKGPVNSSGSGKPGHGGSGGGRGNGGPGGGDGGGPRGSGSGGDANGKRPAGHRKDKAPKGSGGTGGQGGQGNGPAGQRGTAGGGGGSPKTPAGGSGGGNGGGHTPNSPKANLKKTPGSGAGGQAGAQGPSGKAGTGGKNAPSGPGGTAGAPGAGGGQTGGGKPGAGTGKPGQAGPTSPKSGAQPTDTRTPLEKAREIGHGDGSTARTVVDHVKAYANGAKDGWDDTKQENAKEHQRLDDAHTTHTKNKQPPQQPGTAPASAPSQQEDDGVSTDVKPLTVKAIDANTLTLGAGTVSRRELRNFKQYERKLEAKETNLRKISESTRTLQKQADLEAKECQDLADRAKGVKGGEKLVAKLNRLAEASKNQAIEAAELARRAQRAAEMCKVVMTNIQTRYAPLYKAVVDSDETKPAELRFYTDKGTQTLAA